MATRRDSFEPTDPANLPAKQRLVEVAVILAAGVIRTRQQQPPSLPRVRSRRNPPRRKTERSRDDPHAQNTPESGETRLEVSRRTRPYGQRG